MSIFCCKSQSGFNVENGFVRTQQRYKYKDCLCNLRLPIAPGSTAIRLSSLL